jgi:hypothetical protein
MPNTDSTVTSAADKILGLLNPQPEAPKEPIKDEGQLEPETKVEPSTEPAEEQETSQESQTQSEETQSRSRVCSK